MSVPSEFERSDFDPVAGLRAVVLVGFMGAGKTAVGRQLASRLGWEFRDVDWEVERSCGRSIPELFAEEGEARFRALEDEMLQSCVTEASGRVIATGGGWAADPDRIAGLPSDVVSIWLQVSPEVAVQRATGEGPSRPLLQGEDPEGIARTLLESRTPGYAAATHHFDTDGANPAQVVNRILDALARSELEL